MKVVYLLFFATIGFNCSSFGKTDSGDAISFKFVQSVVIDTKTKFEKTKLGGFSGLVIKDGHFYVITDDRGRYGEPRIYRFAVEAKFQKNEEPQFVLTLEEKISIFKKNKKMKIFDFEAFAPLGKGWILSTEGDWSSKPKELPDVFFVKENKIKEKLELPVEFKTVFKGKQTSGLYNNKAFEGIFLDSSAGQLFLLSESGLSQNNDGDSIFYLLEYEIQKEKFSYLRTSRMDFNKHLESANLYNGATDLIKVSENSFLVLTRSVQTALTLQYSNALWLVSRKTVESPWEIKSKFQISGDKDATTPDELNQNYEGMAMWEHNGKKYLVLVSDDNFNSFEKTVFSFFEVEIK